MSTGVHSCAFCKVKTPKLGREKGFVLLQLIVEGHEPDLKHSSVVHCEAQCM